MTMPNRSSEGEILTQGAECLKATDWTIYQLAARKKIPVFKVGAPGVFYGQILRTGFDISPVPL